MDLVDPSLLADLIFEWHEAPFCALTEAAENPNHNMMDSISDLPSIVPDLPQTWPCDSAPVRGSENSVVNFPLVVEKGATLDFAGGQTRRLTSKRGRKSMKAPAKCLQVADVETRPPTHVKHIIRERQRRDDMAAKYLILESLLPSSPKRDRAVVVEDAIFLVQDLEQKKAQLLKRRTELKSKIAPSSHESALLSTDSEGQVETELNGSSANCAINVHMAGKDGVVVVEMVWNRPPPNFHSILLQAVENLGAEVTRCSIARVAAAGGSFVQCFMTCSKPHVPSQVNREPILASENVMGALRDVLTQFS